MAITKDPSRQTPLVATVTVTGGTNVTDIGTYEAIDLPAGARILSGSFYIPAGFTGNGTIAIQHGTNVLIAAADYDAEANIAFDLTTDDSAYAALTAADTVDVVLAVAALTDGTGVLTVVYVINDRATEVN